MMSRDYEKEFETFFKGNNSVVPQHQVERLVRVKKLYDELGTLQKVADRMRLTRERVRQLLNKGEEYNIYNYEPHAEEKFRELVNQFSREMLIKEIKMLIWPTKVAVKLSLNHTQLSRLLKYHDIDFRDYQEAARAGKCLEEYSKIVDYLGHHPSTTEMNTNHKWRNLWARIDRTWGSMNSFRNEYGIEKPAMNIHPNTLECWRELLNKRIKQKDTNIQRLADYMESHNRPLSLSRMAECLGYKQQTTGNYLRALIATGRVVKIGTTTNARYKLR